MATPPRTKMLLSVKEVCQALDIGRSTLYRLKSSGKVPNPVRIGGSLKWRKAELEDWIAAGCPPMSRWEWQGDKA